MLQWPTSCHNNNKWILCVKILGSINKLITVTFQEQLTNFKTKSWKMKTGRWPSAANSNHCIDGSHLNLLLHESTVLIFIVVIIMLGCGSFVKCTLYNICNIIIQSKQSLLLYQLLRKRNKWPYKYPLWVAITRNVLVVALTSILFLQTYLQLGQ